MSNIYTNLAKVQKELKAPKNQYNSFGKYNYRSCEDILTAAKPLCIENNLILVVSDKIVLIGDRHYVESTATVIDIETSEQHSCTASAREAESKKGMDEAQVTGSTSSYARKYALNGLFAIDDTKDADTNEHKQEKEDKSEKANKSKHQNSLNVDDVIFSALNVGITPEQVLANYKVTSRSELTQEMLAHLQSVVAKRANK